MSREKIVYMANQISTFFDSQPHDDAAEGIANHINKFWEPRMRRQFFEILEQADNGFRAPVVSAASLIRKPPEPSVRDASIHE